ncbi:helix-turn-helix domain-containing protein [Achromobacter xylosoxidans]
MASQTSCALIQVPPSARLAGIVSHLTGYRESGQGAGMQWLEGAPLTVPLVISFGNPFGIGLGRADAAAPWSSFASGLYAGPVFVASDGAAECLQVDFTLPGAYRFFGGMVADLANRLVDLGDALGRDGPALRERLGNLPDWPRRFALVEAFILRRLGRAPSEPVTHAYRLLLRDHGTLRIGALAAEIGWSRKHLLHRFRAEMGLGPKALARMLRFHQACRLAREPGSEWAQVAAAGGYADQAHLAREFIDLAGESPQAWARRQAG